MDLNLLQTFIHVARLGGFRKAAEKQYLTPSAVSSRIRLLEEQIGAPLFERGKFGTRLTLSGQRLLAHAEEILSSWNRLCRDVALPDKAEFLLALGATDTIWQSSLADVLPRMLQDAPALALRLETGTAESLTRELLEGSLDAIFLFEPSNLAGLVSEAIGEIPLILVSTREHVDITHIAADEYIQIEWGSAFGAIQDQVYGGGPGAMVRTSVGWLGLQWLLKSGGAAFLPEAMVAPYMKTRTLFPVSGAPIVSRTVYLIYPLQAGRTSLRPDIRALIQTLGEAVSQQPVKEMP